jgi:hypothetical protein
LLVIDSIDALGIGIIDTGSELQNREGILGLSHIENVKE